MFDQKIFKLIKCVQFFFNEQICVVKKNRSKKFLVRNFFGIKKISLKNIVGQNYLRSIRFVPKKIFGRKFCGKKRSGRINPRGRMYKPPPHPHPEKSRVKIVLGCCSFCQVRSHTKFKTTRTFISSRSRVPGGGWGVNSNNHVKPNL